MARASNQQIELGSRLTVEGVDVLLRLHERLRSLLDQLRESLPIRRCDDAYARAHNLPTHDQWFDLGRNIVRLKMAIERIVQLAHVSRDQPFILHQLGIKSRDQWVSWRREEAYQAWKQRSSEKYGEDDEPRGDDLEDVLEEFGIPELQNNWNQVVAGLRWLTSHTKATL
jgi:hypothetical protein